MKHFRSVFREDTNCRRAVFLLAGLLLLLPLGVQSAAPVTFWRTASHGTTTAWQWMARPDFFGQDLEIWETGQVESPGQGVVRGAYVVDTPQYHIVGSYEEQRQVGGDDEVAVQRVYREEYTAAYPQAPGDHQPSERTWTVAGTARTVQAALSPLYGRPALPAPAGLVRRAQTAPRRARLLVQAWAGAQHQAAGLRDHLVATGSPTDRPPIPWLGEWSYQGPPQRYRAAFPGVVWVAPAEAAGYAGSTPVRVTVPPNLPLAWWTHHGPLPGVTVVNVVPGSWSAPPAIPALGPWRLTLAVEADVFAAGAATEVYLPSHAELLLAWWGLLPLGDWEPGVGLWGRFLAQNGALREWGLEKEPGVTWSSDGAALAQRNRLRWSDGGGLAVSGWRCAANPLAAVSQHRSYAPVRSGP